MCATHAQFLLVINISRCRRDVHSFLDESNLRINIARKICRSLALPIWKRNNNKIETQHFERTLSSSLLFWNKSNLQVRKRVSYDTIWVPACARKKVNGPKYRPCVRILSGLDRKLIFFNCRLLPVRMLSGPAPHSKRPRPPMTNATLGTSRSCLTQAR